MSKQKISLLLLAVAIFGIIGVTVVEAGSYDRNTAVKYALDNALKDVPWSSWYSAKGGDCTNFVSHALQAGGWTETGKYLYTKDYAWYFDYNQAPLYSYTWGGANNFYRFLLYGNRATSVRKDQLQMGDVITIDYTNNGVWDHTMMVTGKDSRGLLISEHNDNNRNKPLSEIEQKYSTSYFMAWHIKDSY